MKDIRDAFYRVKKDISALGKEVVSLTKNLDITKNNFIEICDVLKSVNKKNSLMERDIDNMSNNFNLILNKLDKILDNNNIISNKESEFKNNSYNMATFVLNDNYKQFLNGSTNTSTGNVGPKTSLSKIETITSNFKPRNTEILGISTGNAGVQTDRQTDRQTDIRRKNSSYNQIMEQKTIQKKMEAQLVNSIDSAVDVLDSLDSIKKELRLKFKRLTDQELLVFSTIYQLGEELGYSNYKSISKKLNLTESSIRDYVRRLIGKGIPIEKTKVNNKEIQLSISQKLKKITTLNTILELREL